MPFTPRLSPFVAVLLLLTAPAADAQIRFGVSGIQSLPPDLWQGMSFQARAAHLDSRAEIAQALGASVVRLGATDPLIFSFAAIHSGTYRDWTLADAAVGAFSARGLTVCLTLPDFIGGDISQADYQAWIEALAERYDGDTDFGVEEVLKNYEFPDIDRTGSITVADWDASPAELEAWAKEHQVAVIEAGHEPSVAASPGDYAAQLQLVHTATKAASAELKVMLAGTVLDEQGKTEFVDRLVSLSGTSAFDAANVHLLSLGNDLALGAYLAKLGDFPSWLLSVGHAQAERWLGEMSFAAAPTAGGVLDDPRLSERSQAASLVKATVEAAANGYTVLSYANPIEASGPGANSGRFAETGLLVLELVEGFDPAQLPLATRPASATWLRLVELLDGVEPAALVSLVGLPDGARGFAVGDAGWVLWYDWTRDVPAGQPYGGAEKLLQLPVEDGTPWLRVSTFWPAGRAADYGDGYPSSISWDETFVEVQNGLAALSLGQDAVWVTRSAQGPADPGPGDTGSAAEAVPVDEAQPPSNGDDGGCSVAQGGPVPGSGSVLLVLLAFLAFYQAWSRAATKRS